MNEREKQRLSASRMLIFFVQSKYIHYLASEIIA